ncbi:unnamed protein product [marine sediment metagenome]|uniref:Phage terminase small subunit P27 family n=1 Tax=marine sediment metagenome TaxID=412755 RepID=X0T7I0_9ZZZZ
MGAPGRKPKPTALRLLEGNREHRPIPENEPKPQSVKPKKPAWLDKIARREWNRMCKLLAPLGLLSVIDGAALGIYCQAFSKLVQTEKVIAEHGMVYVDGLTLKTRPEVLIAEKAMKTLRATAAEFGMTPSSRSRIQVMLDDEDDDGDLI